MTTIQRKNLLRVARSVRKSPIYDQRLPECCAMSHVRRLFGNGFSFFRKDFKEYFGIDERTSNRIFAHPLQGGRCGQTAARKANQIERIARAK